MNLVLDSLARFNASLTKEFRHWPSATDDFQPCDLGETAKRLLYTLYWISQLWYFYLQKFIFQRLGKWGVKHKTESIFHEMLFINMKWLTHGYAGLWLYMIFGVIGWFPGAEVWYLTSLRWTRHSRHYANTGKSPHIPLLICDLKPLSLTELNLD